MRLSFYSLPSLHSDETSFYGTDGDNWLHVSCHIVEANYRYCPLERCYILQSLPGWRWFSLIGDNGLSAVLYLCKIEIYLCEIKKYLCKIEKYLSKINPVLCFIFPSWSVVKIFEPPKMQYFWRRESWKLKVLKDGYHRMCKFW